MPLSILPTEPRYCRPTCAVAVPSLRSPVSSSTSTAPGVERLRAPVGLREEVLQALDLGALRLHHRFRAGQSRERLVAIPRGEQPHQVAAKATALAERTEQRVKLHRERLERSWCRRTRLTGGHRQVPPMTSTHKRMPGLTNHR